MNYGVFTAWEDNKWTLGNLWLIFLSLNFFSLEIGNNHQWTRRKTVLILNKHIEQYLQYISFITYCYCHILCHQSHLIILSKHYRILIRTRTIIKQAYCTVRSETLLIVISNSQFGADNGCIIGKSPLSWQATFSGLQAAKLLDLCKQLIRFSKLGHIERRGYRFFQPTYEYHDADAGVSLRWRSPMWTSDILDGRYFVIILRPSGYYKNILIYILWV